MKSMLQKFFQKKKKVNIEFCQRNLDQFLDEESMLLFQAIFNADLVTIKEFTCLSQCEYCKKGPYAKVNGETITAAHSNELFTKLKGMME